MPTKRWIDKKNATTFALVHRPQNDPKIHDEDASDMVFKEVAPPNQKVGSTKIKSRSNLEEELELDPSLIRNNEGEAALYGIYYDDTSYDYMQHMRDFGKSTEAHFVEAPSATQKQKVKGKQKLEDALRNIPIEGGPGPLLLDEDILPSQNLRKLTYQDQQDIPDVIGGFQPDMDPRLREALVALEDDTYVDDNEEMFRELVRDGVEVPLEEFVEEGEDGYGYEGGDWDSDDMSESDEVDEQVALYLKGIEDHEMTTEDASQRNSDQVAEFSKFEKVDTAKTEQPPSTSEPQSSTVTGKSSKVTGGSRRRRRRRKRGVPILINPNNTGMSAASVPRSEGLRLLDARFEKVLKEYTEEPDDPPSPKHGPIPEGLEAIAQEFLDNYKVVGRKNRVLRVKNQSGMEELNEIRKGLGPALIRPGGPSE
ncbi:MAG: hypothetical protein M1813_004060 [Trichoglossum hirsutum]|nr:MAG: hypothetical protein M1813_004060 [Trichoglossum hirsutum]